MCFCCFCNDGWSFGSISKPKCIVGVLLEAVAAVICCPLPTSTCNIERGRERQRDWYKWMINSGMEGIDLLDVHKFLIESHKTEATPTSTTAVGWSLDVGFLSPQPATEPAAVVVVAPTSTSSFTSSYSPLTRERANY